MHSFNTFIDEKYGKELEEINQASLDTDHINELLNQYKEVILTNIIEQFGLSSIFDIYKRGGNVTTLNNAEQGVFANNNDEHRYKQDYSQDLRKQLYEKDFKKNRKQIFQTNDAIVDDYTGKILPKDGRAHRDHVVSACEIQNNNEARLYMSDKARGKLAVNENNLAWTNGSLNQSKGEYDLIEWMNKNNSKDASLTNAEYYEINAEKATHKYNKARQYVDKEVKKAKVDYYMKSVKATGVKQGIAVGERQAIGLIIYEFQDSLLIAMKAYFKKYKSLKTLHEKIEEFKQACIYIKNHMISKAKKILASFVDGFINGFIANLVTVFINAFATTAKNIVRILNEGIYSLIKAVKILIKPPDGLTKKEAVLEASKVIAASVIATLGAMLTESFVVYLKTTPFAPFANLVGGVLGGILTGIVSVTVVYAIDNYAEILRKLKNIMSDLTYDLKISSSEIRQNYYSAIETLDRDFRLILERIYDEYEELHLLIGNAYNMNLSAEHVTQNSIILARKLKVKENDILKSNKDVLDFFSN